MTTRMKHPVHDTDTHFIIDPVTREMTNQASQKTCLIQHDHNSERFTFEVPAFIEGHDMLQCDSVQVHYINVDSQTKEQSAGVYEVTDFDTIPDEDKNGLCFSWLISHNATEYVGSLSFLVRFACYGDDGNLSYVWNTAIYSGISVSNGIDNGEAVINDYADILNKWYNEILAFRLVDLNQIITSEDSEGENVWCATFADGTTSELRVRNGAKGEKGDMPDMTGYVKTTDAAVRGGEPGLIKLSAKTTQGISLMSDGTLTTYGATTAQVGGLMNMYSPITPSNLTYAVKAGLLGNTGIFQYGEYGQTLNPTTTDKELTTEEKAAIAEWLGTKQVELVTYVGTGKASSEANACSVTFNSAPRLIMILGYAVPGESHWGGTQDDEVSVNVMFCEHLTTTYTKGHGVQYGGTVTSNRYGKKSEDGKTISWYVVGNTGASTMDKLYQYNLEGATYYVLAVY